MAYYGGGPPPPHYNQGPAAPHGLGPMFAGPPGYGQQHPYDQNSGMYHGPPQGYNGYDEHMQPPYGVQEYYNQQGYPIQGHPGMGQMEEGLYPRPHINPSFLPPENPPQSAQAQEKPTKILRNPYPTVSKAEIRGKQTDEVYDPSNPTLSSANNANNNNSNNPAGPRNPMDNSSMGYQRQNQHQNQNQNQPMFHQQMQMAPQPLPPPPHQYHQPPPLAIPQTQQPVPVTNANLPPRMPMFENMSNANYNSSQSHSQPMSRPPVNDTPRQEQSDPNVKTQVMMTGLVTHVSPGAFGMISDEIFFQESCVSGPLPSVGDKVVVEAEPVKGMPFKYNAKKVTKLDADLVRGDDNGSSRSAHHTTAPTNVQQQQPHPRYERPDFGPLPTMPESLNLPKPCPPPNLSEMMPSSSSQPLKSILKRKGSPTMKRNPPPPPVISKAGVLENLKPASASSFKHGVFAMDLNRDVPRVFSASNAGPPLEFPEFTYVRENLPPQAHPEQIRQTSPRITRLLPSSDFGRPPARSPEFERRKAVSPSPVSIRNDIFEQRDQSPIWRNKSRSKSPERNTVRRRSNSPSSKRKSRRSTSRSKSPRDNRRSRRSRSKSSSPKRHKHPSPRSSRVARSPSPRNRRRSRSASSRSRRRSRSSSPKSRRKSRSITPRSRRRVSRSPDRRRSTSRSKRHNRSKRSSKSPSRRRRSSSSVRSASPTTRTLSRSRGNFASETVKSGGVTSTTSSITASKPAPIPIKFQIANPPKQQSLVPNPSFKGQQGANYVQNPAFNITKTVSNVTAADTKGHKKKPKEQEPAFRVIEEGPKDTSVNKMGTKGCADDKIKQWEAERQALKSKVVTELTSDKLLQNPVKILQLKQTIQNDLHELRSKESNAKVGVKLLENPNNIQQLRQTVEKDLQELRKDKPSAENNGPATKVPLNISQLKSSVQQGLKELRSKFDNQAPKPSAPSTESRPGPSSKPVTINNDNNNKTSFAKGPNNGSNIPPRTVRNTTSNISDRAKNPKNSTPIPPESEAPQYDEEMERLQEEIHRQRFLEEERRLRSVGDQGALRQLYYMEDRRQRRLEERHLANIRLKEIQLKKDKNFGDLQRLREEYGPPIERLNQERQLRQTRMDEEMQESQLHGQAEAIRRQELEYQQWLEEEAHARRDSERASRGFEGRVKRRRTPSPPMHQHNQGPQQMPHPHDQSRRRSRSASFERYRDDYRRRSHRSRSREMEYDQFVMAHGGMPHPMHMDGPGFHPQHGGPPHGPPHGYGPPPDHFDGPPPGHFDEPDGFYISRAMDSVSRRQEELSQREMEIEQRMEMAGRRMGGHPPPGYGNPGPQPHHSNHDDGEYGRFVVRRR